MSVRRIAVAAFSAVAVGGIAAANAADLDPGYSYKDSPYDDPRYSDIYRHPVPPSPPPRYAEPYRPPLATPPYVEERYAPPPPPPHAYSYDPRGYDPRYRQPATCVPRDVIRGQLEARGWHDFHDAHPAGNVVHIRARRPNGRLFDITLDRCSGQVLGVEPFDHRSAEAPPPDWRYRSAPYGRY